MSQRQEEAYASATVHLRAGRLDQAAGILLAMQLGGDGPGDAVLWCVLAWIYEAAEKDGEAIACYRRALDLAPGLALATRGMEGLLYRRVARGRAAEAASRPDEAAARYGEAMLLGDTAEAADALRRLALERRFGDLPSPTAAAADGLRFHAARLRLEQAMQFLQAGDAERAYRRFRELEASAGGAEAAFAEAATKGAEIAARLVPRTPSATLRPSGSGSVERLVEAGRIEEAAVLARKAVADSVDPDGAHASWQSLRQRLLDPPGRLVLPDIGAVSVACEGPIRRLRLLDRPARGVALSFHFPQAVLLDAEDPMLAVHSLWEAREVARALLERGWNLDVVPADGSRLPTDAGRYDLVFSLHGIFARHLDRLAPGARKILLLTGSAPAYQNRREAERIAALAQRRPGDYRTKRIMDEAGETRALELADHVLLLGNQHTLSTYPESFRPKIAPLAPTGSLLPPATRPAGGREFLWHGGTGVVLKGLDRALEAAARHPDWILNVVGFPQAEPDFDLLYETELYRTPSIRLHGAMPTDTPRFRAAIAGCFAFVAPAASEGMSTAVLTCLALGLYPILSRDNGVDLPSGCGVVLETCEVDEVEQAMAAALALPAEEMKRQSEACRRYAAEAYSRARYARTLRARLDAWTS